MPDPTTFRSGTTPRLLRTALAVLATVALLTGCSDTAEPDDPCADVTCGDNASCAADSGVCACDEGYLGDGQTCSFVACSTDSDCDDGNSCNGVETCSAATGSCQSGQPVVCGDNAICDTPSGQCACAPAFHDVGDGCVPIGCTSDVDCDDGNACNGLELCDQDSATCVPGEPVACAGDTTCDPADGACLCDDGQQADDTGACPASGCTNDAACDDGLACNGAETCDLETGACLAGEAVTCDEENEVCGEPDGACVCAIGYRPGADGCVAIVCSDDDDCQDGNVCNGREICDVEQNACRPAPSAACGANQICDPLAPPSDRCSCFVGFRLAEAGGSCVQITDCTTDADCDPGPYCRGAGQCNANGRCVTSGTTPTNDVQCDINARCDNDLMGCVCNPGYVDVGNGCEPLQCAADADCDDGIVCNGVERCDTGTNACVPGDAITCDGDSYCSESAGECVCPAGLAAGSAGCEPIACTSSDDCTSPLACGGSSTCDVASGVCTPGAPVSCGEGACAEHEGTAWCLCPDGFVLHEGICAPVCPVPHAPLLRLVARSKVLSFVAGGSVAIETAVIGLHQPVSAAVWTSGHQIALNAIAYNPVRVLARVQSYDCVAADMFDHVYELVDRYPSLPIISNQPNPGTDAIAGRTPANASGAVNPLFVGWASGIANVTWGTEVDSSWRVPERIYGPPRGGAGIVVLGNGGHITVTFDHPITDGPGPDFAVFENAFVSGPAADEGAFLELAVVEVSSDGVHFVRFDTSTLRQTPVGGYGHMSPRDLHGFAGRHPVFWGDGFDLNVLRQHPLVRKGVVDVDRITHVRVVDVVGDGSLLDSFGNPVYDATPTWGSGGFDIDAIGVIHWLVEP